MEDNASDIQSRFAALFGYSNRTTWDGYPNNDVGFEALKRKIALVIASPNDEKSTDVSKKKMETLRASIVKAIWNQRKYNNGELLMSPIFVCNVTEKNPVFDTLINKALLSTSYSIHPVFRIRKCVHEDDSSNCCMIFVDENARVYQCWELYMKNNTLADGVLVAPSNGVYIIESGLTPNLDVFYSPEHFLASKLLRAGDVTSSVVGVGASVVIIGALAFPVLVPAVGVAAGTGIVCGIYSVSRAGFTLFRRAKHEQPIHLSDVEARACWIGILGGVTGLAAGAAAQGLAFWAKNGNQIGGFVRGAVNTLNVSAMAANGAGVVNGFVGFVVRRMDNEEISATEVLQLATSLFLFTHSVYNFQLAETIITNARNSTINDYRSTLSRNQKRAFDKIVKETVRVNGPNAKADVIRGLRNIPNQKEYFRDIYKINKKLNENSVRPTLNSEGELLLNNGASTDPATLRTALRTEGSQNVFANVGGIPESHVVSGTYNPTTVISTTMRLNGIMETIRVAVNIVNSEDLRETLINYIENLTHQALDRFVSLVTQFVSIYGDDIQRRLHRIIPIDKFFSDIFNFLFGLAGNIEELDNLLSIIDINLAHEMIRDFFDTLRPSEPANKTCKKCNGTYFG